MTDQALLETVSAWRDARDKMRPGSEQWKQADDELKKAETQLHRRRK
jgi:hypothetical protein